MLINKNHWYDGYFYDRVIAPNQDTSIKLIKTIIPEGSEVIDMGCGTGRFAFKLSSICQSIDCVDLSIKNIDTAKSNLKKRNISNIRFYHDDISRFLQSNDRRYDFGILSYILHEVDYGIAQQILMTALEHTNQLIIIDYLVPRPKSIWSLLNTAVEFLAGNEHYKNFGRYVDAGGLNSLIKTADACIVQEITNKPGTNHIAVVKK